MIEKFLKMFFPTFVTHKRNIESAKVFERARDDKGRLKADDKKTPTFNEAWVGGQAPAKKKAAPKKAAPKKRGRPKGSKNKGSTGLGGRPISKMEQVIKSKNKYK